MKVYRKIIEIDEERCDGCGQCVIACAEGAIRIVDGKARVISDNLCDGLGACLGECPQDALKIVEREAEEFDEEEVAAHLEKEAGAAAAHRGCPSAAIQIMTPAAACVEVNRPAALAGDAAGDSCLGNWPVQVQLVPPTAPFLKGADLLVMADCVPVAFPTVHRDFLQGRAVTLGCPKLDDIDAYVQKFTAIFKQAGIKSITVVVMEVPCCSGLPAIVKKAQAAAGTQIPMAVVVISTRGAILRQVAG
ncbi:MAG: 4Fe-4S binding protein [Desulfobacterales bacterium]|jgi:Fe-S-cluster-containing hydrogenase component 2